ncbi:Ribokinase-like protein [Dactylonectria macrodidyma]|uniref:Ribokinase-like protein n=1 Tax=Dactylonectria macrodidyma TaxID=307937 RepID=A0A9P9FLG6_9HYPO|nr:Ribokinase-like protein [Dactylonectria macrodidyma]
MKHLIFVGACYMDTILRDQVLIYSFSVPFFPPEDSKLRATALNIRRGGNCPNSIQVLEQLLAESDAVQPYLVSCLPNISSAASRRIIASFGPSSKLDFRHCIYNEACTEAASSYVIRSLETGSRTLVNYNDLPEMTTEQFESIARSFSLNQETWWHFEGRIPDTTLKCIRLLRSVLPKAQISVEIEKPGREGLPELAAEADVVFYSRSWAEGRGHESPESCLRAEVHDKTSLALCTWGADGAAGLSRVAREYVRCPAKCEAEGGISVVDAVGAGDTFVAGMLYGLVCHTDEWSVGQKLSFAVRLATLKVQREGFAGLGADMLGCVPGSS